MVFLSFIVVLVSTYFDISSYWYSGIKIIFDTSLILELAIVTSFGV
jgi:hypothetical protein